MDNESFKRVRDDMDITEDRDDWLSSLLNGQHVI